MPMLIMLPFSYVMSVALIGLAIQACLPGSPGFHFAEVHLKEALLAAFPCAAVLAGVTTQNWKEALAALASTPAVALLIYGKQLVSALTGVTL